MIRQKDRKTERQKDKKTKRHKDKKTKRQKASKGAFYLCPSVMSVNEQNCCVRETIVIDCTIGGLPIFNAYDPMPRAATFFWFFLLQIFLFQIFLFQIIDQFFILHCELQFVTSICFLPISICHKSRSQQKI